MDIKEFLNKYLNIEQMQDLLKKYNLEVSGTKNVLIDRLVSYLVLHKDSNFDKLVNYVYDYLHKEDIKEICKNHYLSILDLEKKLSGLKRYVSNSKRDLLRRRQWAHWHLFPHVGLFAMIVGLFLFIIALSIIYLTPQPTYNGDLTAYTNALKTYADTVKAGGYLAIFSFLIFGSGSIWGLYSLGKKRSY